MIHQHKLDKRWNNPCPCNSHCTRISHWCSERSDRTRWNQCNQLCCCSLLYMTLERAAIQRRETCNVACSPSRYRIEIEYSSCHNRYDVRRFGGAFGLLLSVVGGVVVMGGASRMDTGYGFSSAQREARVTN